MLYARDGIGEHVQSLEEGLAKVGLKANDNSALRVKEVADIIVPIHDTAFISKDKIPSLSPWTSYSARD